MYADDVILQIPWMRTAFPYLASSCWLMMKIPVTTANAACSFSCSMKRVKTYRLSYLSLISSEPELSSCLLKDPSELNHQSVCYVIAHTGALHLFDEPVIIIMILRYNNKKFISNTLALLPEVLFK